MPLQTLQQAFERSTPAYENKLGQVTQFFRGVQQSETVKQQMSEQMAMQKELIEFRSDVEMEQKQELMAQQQAAQAEQERVKRANESFEEIRKIQKDIVDKINKDYPEVINNNLVDYNVSTAFNEASGRFEPIYMINGQQTTDYAAFMDQITRRADFAKHLEHVRMNKEDFGIGTITDTGITLGSNNIDLTIQQVRNDREAAEDLFNKWNQGLLQPAQKVDEPEETQERNPRSQIYHLVTDLKNSLGENGEFQGSLMKKGRWYQFGFGDKTGQRSINFNGSIPEVQTQVTNTIEDFYGIDMKNVRLDSNEVWQAIQTDDRGTLNDEERKLAQRLQQSAQTGDDLPKLLNVYRSYNWAVREWNEKSSSPHRGTNLKHLQINWQGWTAEDGLDNLIVDRREADTQAISPSRRFLTF